MSKAPDLSAFPIPRKGAPAPLRWMKLGPRYLKNPEEEGAAGTGTSAQIDRSSRSRLDRQRPEPPPLRRASDSSGQIRQTVATTVKLDKYRYLRLAEAGRPSPGRLKRRTIQDMVIEALDEWFEKRGL